MNFWIEEIKRIDKEIEKLKNVKETLEVIVQIMKEDNEKERLENESKEKGYFKAI